MSATAFYHHQQQPLEEAIRETKKQVRFWGMIRLCAFLLIVGFVYFFWGKSLYLFASLLFGIVAFLFAVSQSVNVKTSLEKKETKLRLIRLELLQIQTNRGQFDAAKEYADPKQAFAYDLDLFNEGGFFSFINRTSSALGKYNLVQRLLNQHHQNDASFQQKIEALSQHINWSLDFRTSASISSREEAYHQTLKKFSDLEFQNPNWLYWLMWLIPICSFSAVGLDYSDIISSSVSGVMISMTLVPTARLLKQTNAWAAQIGKYEAKIEILLDQLILLKNLPLDLIEKAELRDIEVQLRAWTKIAKRFNLRLNILLSIPLNLFLAWDLRQRYALSQWMKINRSHLVRWEEELADIEVLISAAVLRYNHADVTSYALKGNDIKKYECRGIVHPMIAPNKRIKNDFCLTDKQHFIILTGPNMAGKSTYLRSVGINIVLANADFPVFAEYFEIPDLNLFSSMRTSDDLSQESSYFHAELSRLKYIQAQVSAQKQVFVLLDEILKGTNSKDKEEGSKKFLLKMKRLGAKGIIATHDLSLCALADEDSAFRTNYFDSTIVDEELYFDYTLKDGICQNMNASFLLKKMDLVD